MSKGALIAGKYRLDERLGAGGMGEVWLATHLDLDRRVALKLMHDATNETSVARFLREAKLAARVRHRHVVEILDFGRTASGAPFLVMEHLEGIALEDRLQAAPPPGVQAIVEWVVGFLGGLGAIHDEGLVHRDIKPGNLFLARDADGVVPKILDFGIARAVDGSLTPITQTELAIGTPNYMSPEQVRGVDVDQRTDVYAMGVVLYEALAGRGPFERPSVSGIIAAIVSEEPAPLERLRPDLPPALVAVVKQAMQRDASARFASARAMRDALAAALDLSVRPSGVGAAYGPRTAPAVFAPTMAVEMPVDPEATVPDSGGTLAADAEETVMDRPRPDWADGADGADAQGAVGVDPNAGPSRWDRAPRLVDDPPRAARVGRTVARVLSLLGVLLLGGLAFALRTLLASDGPPPRVPEVPVARPAAPTPRYAVLSESIPLSTLALRWRALAPEARARPVRFEAEAEGWRAVLDDPEAGDEAIRALRAGLADGARSLGQTTAPTGLVPSLQRADASLNLRSGPSTSTEILAVLPDGALIVALEGEVSGVASALGERGSWVHTVVSAEHEGWLAAALLTHDEECVPMEGLEEGEHDGLFARIRWRRGRRLLPGLLVVDPRARRTQLRVALVSERCELESVVRRRLRGELEAVFLSATSSTREEGENLLVVGMRGPDASLTRWAAYHELEREPVWTHELHTDPNAEERGRVVGPVQRSRGRRGWWPVRYTEEDHGPSTFLVWFEGALVVDEAE